MRGGEVRCIWAIGKWDQVKAGRKMGVASNNGESWGEDNIRAGAGRKVAEVQLVGKVWRG